MYVCMYVRMYQCSHGKVVLNVYQIRIMCLYFGDAIVSVFLLQLLLNLVDNIRQKSEQEPKVSGSTAYILLHSRTYIHTYVVRPEHVHPLRLVESQRAARHYICTYIRMSAGALEAETSVDSQSCTLTKRCGTSFLFCYTRA